MCEIKVQLQLPRRANPKNNEIHTFSLCIGPKGKILFYVFSTQNAYIPMPIHKLLN